MKKLSLLALPFVLSLSAWSYTVSITTPAIDRAYNSPAETVEITASVSPKPTPLHTLVLKFDGKVLVANADTATLPTMGQNTGQHTISAELQDETGRVVASDSRTVYFVLNSLIMREQKARAEAQAKYDALPWYKKAISKLKQDDKKLEESQPLMGTADGF